MKKTELRRASKRSLRYWLDSSDNPKVRAKVKKELDTRLLVDREFFRKKIK